MTRGGYCCPSSPFTLCPHSNQPKMKASIIAIHVVLLCATPATANLRGLHLTNEQDGSDTTNVGATELSTAMEDADRNLRGESRKLDNCGTWHNQKCSQPGAYCNALLANQCTSGYCCESDFASYHKGSVCYDEIGDSAACGKCVPC